MLEEIVKKANLTDVLIVIITSLAIVSFWRGIWGLMDIYLYPTNPTLSLIISVVIGLIILLMILSHRFKNNILNKSILNK